MSDHGETVTLEEWINAASAATVEAMRSDDSEQRMALARSIDDVQAQLPPKLNDLSAYLDALEALLQGADWTTAAELVDDPYAEPFDRVVDAIAAVEEPQHRDRHHDSDHHDSDHHHGDHRAHPPTEPDGAPLSLGEMLETITQDAVHVMQSGTDTDRARMAQGLEILRFQAAGGMEWPELAEFLATLQDLLRDGTVPAPAFGPPFDQAWARIEASTTLDTARTAEALTRSVT
jgi:hypothetical protein